MSLHDLTLAELSRGLAAGEYSSVELTQHFLKRIEQYDGELNSFITVTAEQALAQAAAADALRAEGKAGPLTGIPFAQKDIFCTKGVRTSSGSKMLDNFISPYDAHVVEKLNNAGIVTLGKTNMDEFAMGSSNETSWYGPVKNPWDTTKVPGGSSGGSAASVAARLAPASSGTDTGGSIRQPASLTGITGFKPTYGRCSRYGMIAFSSSLDQAGTFTRTAEDAALLMGEMAGFDPRDSTSIDREVPDYMASLNDSLVGLKIGVPKEFFGDGMADGTRAAVDAALEQYKAMGAELVDISLPNIGLSVPVYYVVAPAEASANLSRFDGVRYGYRCEDPVDLNDLYTRSRGEGFGAEVKRRILVGTYALSSGYYDAYYIRAQKIRRLIRDDFVEAFKSVDVIMGPVAQDVAFGIGEKNDDPVAMYYNDVYTIAVNLAGLPGMSIPAGFDNQLPVGLQIIGKHFDEARLFNVAHQYQQQTDWHKQSPAAFA